ncbi:hypothetical protein D0Y65_014059 [Glycine soja]|nr:hypothetical protein D0Y65_014059 [Glycine soja]
MRTREEKEKQLVLTSLRDFGGGEIGGKSWPSSLRFFILQIFCDSVRLGNVVVVAAPEVRKGKVDKWDNKRRRKHVHCPLLRQDRGMATMSLTFAVAAPSLNYLPSTTQTVIMCEPCNGTGWLVCDFCNGQKTNVKAQNNKRTYLDVLPAKPLDMSCVQTAKSSNDPGPGIATCNFNDFTKGTWELGEFK